MGTATCFIHLPLALCELLIGCPAELLRNFDGFWSMGLLHANWGVKCLSSGF